MYDNMGGGFGTLRRLKQVGLYYVNVPGTLFSRSMTRMTLLTYFDQSYINHEF